MVIDDASEVKAGTVATGKSKGGNTSNTSNPSQPPTSKGTDQMTTAKSSTTPLVADLDIDQFTDDDPPITGRFNLIQFAYEHVDQLKGRDNIKLYNVPLELSLIWSAINAKTDLPIGIGLPACLVYVLNQLRETTEFDEHRDVVARARNIEGLKMKRKVFFCIGSMKRPTFAIDIPAVDGMLGNALTDEIQFKAHEDVKSLLYSTADILAMRATNLATVCLAKGLADADDAIEPEYREWADRLYLFLVASIRERTEDIVTSLQPMRIVKK